jgi:hypothetical protein
VHPDATPVENTPVRPKPHPESGGRGVLALAYAGKLLPELEVCQHRRERPGVYCMDGSTRAKTAERACR